MKHCLIQREKNKKKFTKTFIGTGPYWEYQDVTARYVPFNRKHNKQYNKQYSYISLWGEDDFGIFKPNATEKDWQDLISMCKNGKTPTVEKLKELGYRIDC